MQWWSLGRIHKKTPTIYRGAVGRLSSRIRDFYVPSLWYLSIQNIAGKNCQFLFTNKIWSTENPSQGTKRSIRCAKSPWSKPKSCKSARVASASSSGWCWLLRKRWVSYSFINYVTNTYQQYRRLLALSTLLPFKKQNPSFFKILHFFWNRPNISFGSASTTALRSVALLEGDLSAHLRHLTKGHPKHMGKLTTKNTPHYPS